MPRISAKRAASSATPLQTQAARAHCAQLFTALDNIFHHPNVGPFIGKQLIQQLVTSNPTPAYERRQQCPLA